MPVFVNDLRLAWVWTEVFAEAMANEWSDAQLVADLNLPQVVLARSDHYKQAFDRLELDPRPPVTTPWDGMRPGRPHFFWKYYLKSADPAKITADKAWKMFTPLRIRSTKQIGASWLPGRLWMERFHYPHGLALIVNAQVKDRLRLADAVEMAHRVARDPLEVTGAAPAAPITLMTLAAEELDAAKAAAFGAQKPAGRRSDIPFTVATVVQGEGVDPALKPPQNGDFHRALEGLCSWHATWKSDNLHTLAQARLGTRKNAPLGHVLYALSRGRAVWFPGSFCPSVTQLSSLGCYHRNLMFLSLQTESLCELMTLAAAYIDANKPFLPSMSQLVRAGAGTLGRLYGKKGRETYRSASAPRHLNDKGIDAINLIRNHFGDSALSP